MQKLKSGLAVRLGTLENMGGAREWGVLSSFCGSGRFLKLSVWASDLGGLGI
jgi:hypothetical protein